MGVRGIDPLGQGRFGGVVLMLVGAAMLVAGLLLETTPIGVGYDRGLAGAIPIAALCFGPVAIAFGIWSYRSAPANAKLAMSRADARALLASKPLPFWFCQKCHAFAAESAGGHCVECGSAVDCLEIATEADRRIATSAFGA
jgi:hypothetical protein